MTVKRDDAGEKKQIPGQFRVAEVLPPKPRYAFQAAVVKEARNPFRPIQPAQPPESVRKAAELKRAQEQERLERPRLVRTFWWLDGELQEERWLASQPEVERLTRPTDEYDLDLSPMKTIPPGLFSMASAAPGQTTEGLEERALHLDLALELALLQEEKQEKKQYRDEAFFRPAAEFREWEVEECEIALFQEVKRLREVHDFVLVVDQYTGVPEHPIGTREEPQQLYGAIEEIAFHDEVELHLADA